VQGVIRERGGKMDIW